MAHLKGVGRLWTVTRWGRLSRVPVTTRIRECKTFRTLWFLVGSKTPSRCQSCWWSCSRMQEPGPLDILCLSRNSCAFCTERCSRLCPRRKSPPSARACPPRTTNSARTRHSMSRHWQIQISCAKHPANLAAWTTLSCFQNAMWRKHACTRIGSRRRMTTGRQGLFMKAPTWSCLALGCGRECGRSRCPTPRRWTSSICRRWKSRKTALLRPFTPCCFSNCLHLSFRC
mmetsp:Transcript_54413/g.132984  ORF Transcript_54413/g.132984 Transcript_54413/m.132984 type:complete len:228 (-) Transcript_54413:1229-1912(-)